MRNSEKALRKLGIHDKMHDFEPNMTPMLDLIFMLLVFFILTSNVAQHTFDLNIAKADEEYQNSVAESESQSIQITIFKDDTYGYGKIRIETYSQLRQKIAEDKAGLGVSNLSYIIVNDAKAKVENLTTILTYLQAEGVQNVNLLLQS